MSDDESGKWNLEASTVASYRLHVQSRIQDDLQDSLSHLSKHQQELQDLMVKLTLAKKQVEVSVANSRAHVHESCSSLLKSLTEVLTARETELMSQLDQVEQQSMSPLLECETVLSASLKQTQDLLQYGTTLSQNSDCAAIVDSSKATGSSDPKVSEAAKQEPAKTPLIVTPYRIAKFQKDAALDNCLPSVPELCSVACVSVVFPSGPAATLPSLLRQYGTVRRRGPVQLTHVLERPGALLVHWEEMEEDDDDSSMEVKEFVLQCSGAADGDTADDSCARYSTVYRGPDDSFLLQKLCPGVHYWLRVTSVTAGAGAHAEAGKGSRGEQQEGALEAWSLPQLCCTNTPHYRWQENISSGSDSQWRVADDGRLASKQGVEACVVRSSQPQLTPGSTLTLQVVAAAGAGCSDEGFAVSWQPPASPLHLTAPGTLFLSATGSVVVDGVQRLMQLPPLAVGSCVSFTIEQTSAARLRVHIDTSDKQVTYEWAVPAALAADPRLYFSACFAEPLWSIRVY